MSKKEDFEVQLGLVLVSKHFLAAGSRSLRAEKVSWGHIDTDTMETQGLGTKAGHMTVSMETKGHDATAGHTIVGTHEADNKEQVHKVQLLPYG